MTPQEAVKQMGQKGTLVDARTYIDACVATAKADETRRCAARVRRYCSVHDGILNCPHGNTVATDLLTTGGLEAEL